MAANEFKAFINTITEADEKSPIWWAGFMFMNLNVRQMRKTYAVCRDRFGEFFNHDFNRIECTLPSGLVLIKQ